LVILRRFLASIFALFMLSATPIWAQGVKATGLTFPQLTGRVVDQADIIPEEVEAQLISQLTALEAASSDQLVVVTVPSLQGYEIEEYGYRLGRVWQIGQGERLNNGVILLVAPTERKVRIEVGYGLEGVLTDMFTGQVIRNEILPAFKSGDMTGGILAGVNGIERLLKADPAELEARAKRGLKEVQASEKTDPGIIVFLIIFIFFWIWIASLGAQQAKFRRAGGWNDRRSGVHDWDNHAVSANVASFVLGALLGGGGRGGGGGSGGGFGGGGGSFGGGGSSGSW
jgi:uncharacterized protein